MTFEKGSLVGGGRRGLPQRASPDPVSGGGRATVLPPAVEKVQSGCATPRRVRENHCGSRCALNEVLTRRGNVGASMCDGAPRQRQLLGEHRHRPGAQRLVARRPARLTPSERGAPVATTFLSFSSLHSAPSERNRFAFGNRASHTSSRVRSFFFAGNLGAAMRVLARTINTAAITEGRAEEMCRRSHGGQQTGTFSGPPNVPSLSAKQTV